MTVIGSIGALDATLDSDAGESKTTKGVLDRHFPLDRMKGLVGVSDVFPLRRTKWRVGSAFCSYRRRRREWNSLSPQRNHSLSLVLRRLPAEHKTNSVVLRPLRLPNNHLSLIAPLVMLRSFLIRMWSVVLLIFSCRAASARLPPTSDTRRRYISSS